MDSKFTSPVAGFEAAYVCLLTTRTTQDSVECLHTRRGHVFDEDLGRLDAATRRTE